MSKTYHRRLLASASLAVVAATAAAPALAQTADLAGAGGPVVTALAAAAATPAEEIVVTARRQSEKAQDVPIALSVVTAKKLERTGAFTLNDLQSQTPSFTAYQSNARNSSIGIRGIGVSSASDGLDTTVGVYVDDVYLGRPGMALEDLIDVDQLEVLRGPQGTLFGRNTAAGVVNITTKQPSFQYGVVGEASFGNLGYNQERVSLTGPLLDDVLAFRFTAFNTERDGYVSNTVTGIPGNGVGRSGARLQLLAQPNDKVSVRVIGEYSQENDTCCVSVLKSTLPGALASTTARTLTALAELGVTPTASTTSVPYNSPQDMLTDQNATSVEVKADLGWADLTSVSAERYWHFHPLQEGDSTALDINEVSVAQTHDWQVSQELRLASKPGRFTWQAGVYFFNQNLQDHFILDQWGTDASAFYTAYARTANPAAAAITVTPHSQYNEDDRAVTDSAAAFAQANYQLTDKLTLTGGLRYTYDDKKGVAHTSDVGTVYGPSAIPFNYDVDVNGGDLSYLASLSYKFSKDALAYLSYSTGYQSAGLNLNSAVTAGSPLVLQPEHVGDWEAGVKQTLFDHSLTLNLDGFWTNLSGLQANIVPTNGARSYLANVGTILSRGVEAEATIDPLEGLELTLTGSYDDAHYTSYPNAPCPLGVTGVCSLTGKPVYEAPRWIASALAAYQFEIAGQKSYVQAQYAFRSDAYGTVDDGPLARIPAYGLLNLRLGTRFGDGRYDVSLWANNVTNQTYYLNVSTASIVGAGVFGISGQPGVPQTYGVTLRAQF